MNNTHRALTLAAGISAAILPLSSFAQQPAVDGVYVSGEGGFAFIPSVSNRGNKVFYWNNFTSYDFAGSLGYKSGPMRYEGQFNYISARLRKLGNVNIGGRTSVYSLMGNLYFDFDMLGWDVVPYLGGGIGWANLNSNATGISTQSANAFAYQGMTGLRYAFDDNVTLDLGYRYFGTTTVNTFGSAWGTNLVNLGVTFNFG